MVHRIMPTGKGKPASRAGYESGDYGRLQGTEGLPLNREQRRAKARLERKQAAKQKAAEPLRYARQNGKPKQTLREIIGGDDER